jgi:nucleotide-binding universal stress UspA family protein
MVAHVLQLPIAPGLPATLRAQLRSVAERGAEKNLEGLVRMARSAGVTRVRSQVLKGSVAPQSIVDAARRWKTDLIVLGTHGRTGLRAIVLGSVAARVLATASCPVLTVRR